MFKKVFGLVSIVMLSFVIIACGDSGANDDETATPNPTRGIWDGDIFVSEYLGLEFELPSGWSKLDDDEIAEFIGVVFLDGAPEMGLEFPDEVLEALEGGQFHDMLAIHPFEGTNVQIIFERNAIAMLISEEEYLETVVEQFEEVSGLGMEFRDFEIASEPTTIGNYDWQLLSAVIELGPGIEMESHTFVSIQGPNIRVITITLGFGSDTLEDVISMFN